MRKIDQSVISTVLSAVLTLALLVVANRPPSAPAPAVVSATPVLSHWALLAAASQGVQMRGSDTEALVPAVAGQKLGVRGAVQTDEQGTAQVNFEDGAVVRLAPYTTVIVAGLPLAADDPLGRLQLLDGKVWVSLKSGGIEVETRAGVAAVRGSFAEFEYRQGAAADASDDVLVVRCLEGLCAVQSETQPLIILGNLEALELTFNGRPPVRVALGPDAVQDFIKNNPDSAGLAPTLTAAAPPSATPAPDAPEAASSSGAPSIAGTATLPNTSSLSETVAITGTGNMTTTSPLTGTLVVTLTRTPTRTGGSILPTATRIRTSTPRPTITWFIWYTPVPYRTWTKSPTVPSRTPTRTPTLTATATQTDTVTATTTQTNTVTATATPSPTGTATATGTATPTGTETPTATDTAGATSTATPTPTDTPTSTATPTPTPTSTPNGIVVNTTADAADAAPGDGICETAPGNGQCSLRAAIQEANSPAGLHSIILAPGTYALTLAGAGEDAAATGDLDITGQVTIVGSGAASTVIDASALGDRVFQVVSLTSTLQISGVTIRNGNSSNGDGGGIYNAGTLVLTDGVITGNSAHTGQGGGVFSAGGSSVTLSRVWVTANMANSGGGIAAVGDASHTVMLDVAASAVTANTANGDSTGIFTDRSTGSLVNVTVSGNISGTLPAILAGSAAGPLTLTNVTIAGNYVGVANSGILRVANSIFANNSSANCSGTVVSLGHNLDSDASCGLSGAGDQSGVGANLDSLGNYGGSTPTDRLQSTSPARDTGDNGQCPPTDQRGFSRPQNSICDIGAVEYVPGTDGP